MMWAYVVRAKKVHATDISSNDELHALEKDADWLWVDCFEPNSEELQLVSEFLCPGTDTKMLEDMK
jgi:Mg2+ and Co2+ transporter CorA